MEKKFEELYKQYLSGQISQMDFELLKIRFRSHQMRSCGI